MSVTVAFALSASAALAQSRFDGTNDVPGQQVINGTTTKINPDRIPEESSMGDTTLRPRVYMSPSSRCTKLEDRLPGGCEANTLLRKNAFKRGLIYQDGAPSGFPLSAIVLLP